MLNKIVFLAIPTKGAVSNNAINESTLKLIAKLHEQNPNVTFLCPMVHGYAIMPFLENQDVTWSGWKEYCETLISISDELWVLTLEGYEQSEGVRGEIAYADYANIPVTLV